jgi:TetR/AcrR family acrAB operon transcriptional repressor
MIVEAALWEFHDHGVARASLDQIARRAKVSRGAVHWHFKSKLALLNAIFDDAAMPLDPFAMASPAEPVASIEVLADALAMRWHAATSEGRERRLYTLLFRRCEETSETAVFWKRVREANRRAEADIEAWLGRRPASGRMPLERDIRVRAQLIHATLCGLLRKVLHDPACPHPTAAEVAGIVQAISRH